MRSRQAACLVALATAAGWVKWQGGKPVEYRMRQPGVPMPARADLGDNDRAKWEFGPDGQPRDPWQNTHFVYLIDPQTAEEFTFSTSSWGGRDCVINLAGQIKRMRDKYPDAVPRGRTRRRTDVDAVRQQVQADVEGGRLAEHGRDRRDRSRPPERRSCRRPRSHRSWTTTFRSNPLTAAPNAAVFFGAPMPTQTSLPRSARRECRR